MIGSEAEIRLRIKAEALLRVVFPSARIVHEFDLRGVRLDLAAITDETIVLVEIKSERDTLDRLANQVKSALSIGGEVWIVYADRWEAQIRQRCQSQDESKPIYLANGGLTWGPNALYIPGLSGCALLREEGAALTSGHGFDPRNRRRIRDRFNNRRLLGLLHKGELLALAKPLGGRVRHDTYTLIDLCHEHLTGREIRRGAMAALRARNFWKADPATPQADTPAIQPQGQAA